MASTDLVSRAGFARILSSGGAPNALEGAPVLAQMVEAANAHGTVVVPGGGVSMNNLERILRETNVCVTFSRTSTDCDTG